ncbi:hypothetical protein WKH56_33135 [Priestia sp. SB1]|uniref:hypothetical protein n=1 Tax=Priestia sp. SB1 TaxID=3132359 RepID=UPI00317BC211
MKKLVIAVIVLAVGFVGTGAFASYQLNRANENEKEYAAVQKENKALKKQNDDVMNRLVALQNNQETKVKEDVQKFLDGYFNYDTALGERAWTKVNGLVTDRGMSMVRPPGAEGEPEKSTPETAVKSSLNESKIYYTPISEEKANVFVRAYQTITVNKVPSKTQTLLDIDVVYDAKKNKWLVDKMELVGGADAEEFVN